MKRRPSVDQINEAARQYISGNQKLRDSLERSIAKFPEDSSNTLESLVDEEGFNRGAIRDFRSWAEGGKLDESLEGIKKESFSGWEPEDFATLVALLEEDFRAYKEYASEKYKHLKKE